MKRRCLLLTQLTCARGGYEHGLPPGPPHSEAFLKLSTNVLGFTSTLPLLVMETFGKDMPVSTHGSAAHLSFFEPVNGRASLTNSPALTARAGFHQRGSTSGGMPQAGFALDLVDEFNEPKARRLLGMPPDSDWILYAPNSYDPVLIHNPFIHQLSRDLAATRRARASWKSSWRGTRARYRKRITKGSTCWRRRSRSAGAGKH
jgi:hypothetical protein